MPASIDSYVPQCVGREFVQESRPARRVALFVWGALAVGALAFVGLIFSAPLALSEGRVFFAQAVYRGFHLACHQIPERSFYLAGYPLAVCARCAGIYLGFAGAAVVYPLVRSLRHTETPARAWLLVSVLPLTVDFALGFSGVWENTHLSRFTTGALLGAVSVFYVVPGLLDLTRSHASQRFFSIQTPLKG